MAGRDNMAAPPAFHPFIRIDFPSRVIEHGVNRHQHQKEQRHPDMQGNKQSHDWQEPRRAHRLYRVKRKTRPGRGLDGAVMAFMRPLKQLPVMHDAVREIKPCVLRKEIDKHGERQIGPIPCRLRRAAIQSCAARLPHLGGNGGREGIDKGANSGQFNFIAYRVAGGVAPRKTPRTLWLPFPERVMNGPDNGKISRYNDRRKSEISDDCLSYRYGPSCHTAL